MSAGAHLKKQARDIARVMHRLAHWPKSLAGSQVGEGLFRLPPVFLVGDEGSKERGLKNLSAMINVLADYEGKRSAGSLRLADLPALYAKYGGDSAKPPSMRTMHNWVQQVAFAIRAAYVDVALQKGLDADETADYVCGALFPDDGGIVFVAKSNDNPNEYKPLRYATASAKVSWLRQEAQQRCAGAPYGVDISPDEWAQYGIGGHFSTTYETFIDGVNAMSREACGHDARKQYELADDVDVKMANLFRSIEGLSNFVSEPETSK